MYIDASCLCLVSYPLSSCIYLSHVTWGLAVHCGAIKRNLAAHPIGWWSFFSEGKCLFKKRKTNFIRKKKLRVTWCGIRIWCHQLSSWRKWVYLSCCSRGWIRRWKKNPQTLSRSSRHHCRFTHDSESERAESKLNIGAKRHVIAQCTCTQRRDITAAASTPGGSQCLPPGAEVFPRGSCGLWKKMNRPKSSQVSWKKHLEGMIIIITIIIIVISCGR